jgi:hypothetical protein
LFSDRSLRRQWHLQAAQAAVPVHRTSGRAAAIVVARKAAAVAAAAGLAAAIARSTKRPARVPAFRFWMNEALSRGQRTKSSMHLDHRGGQAGLLEDRRAINQWPAPRVPAIGLMPVRDE